ncbi:bridging integrator 3-like [Saccopteryx bilineata]|uniref:bridging integrator 3-like n=1 Tax=Saccopteryx bilineata TaxID=59482 RepID=UPI0033905169
MMMAIWICQRKAGRISLDSFSNPLSEQDQDFLRMVTVLGMAMKRKDAVSQKKVNKIQKILSEPFKKFGSVFPSFSMAMKQPKQALQGCRRLKAKVEKYKEKEKTEPGLAKLHQAQDELQLLQDNLEAKLKQLLDEMLCFYNSQLDYFQSSFEFLILTQIVHYSKMPEIFGDFTQHLDQPDHPDKQQDWENVIKLSEPRALLLWLMTEWPVTLGRLLGHKLVSLVFSSLISGSQAKMPPPRERMAAGGLGTEVAPALAHQLFRMSPVPGTPILKVSGALMEVYSCEDLIELKMVPLTMVQGGFEAGASHQEREWQQNDYNEAQRTNLKKNHLILRNQSSGKILHGNQRC